MAYEYYSKSFVYCPTEQNNDERLNLAIASMNYGKVLSDVDADFLLNFDVSDLDNLEKSKILTAKGIYYFSKNDYNKAIPFFETLAKSCNSSGASVIFHSYCYQRKGNLDEAIKVLKQGLQEAKVNDLISTIEIYFTLADRYIEKGNTSGKSDFSDAIEIYEKHLLTPENRTRVSTIKYARLLHHLNKMDKVTRLCNEMLSGNVFPLPVSEEDFYFDGWANFLSGRGERAKYDYDRSKEYLKYYDLYK